MAPASACSLSADPGVRFALSDELSALELDLSDRVGAPSVLQITAADEDELRTFVNPDTAIQVFDAEAKQHQEG